MIGAIAGDIIGSRFEGHPAPPPEFALFHPHCRFTDDTVCSLAVADALMGARNFAASLRAFVRRHPQRGYGGMFIDWAFADDAPAYGSWGNGAPMRVAVVGWLAQEGHQLLQAQPTITQAPDLQELSYEFLCQIGGFSDALILGITSEGFCDLYGAANRGPSVATLEHGRGQVVPIGCQQSAR